MSQRISRRDGQGGTCYPISVVQQNNQAGTELHGVRTEFHRDKVDSSLFGRGGNGLSKPPAVLRIFLDSGVRQATIAVMASFFVQLGDRFFIPA